MRIIFSPSNSPAFNLAAEEFLFNERQDDLLFLYVNEPSVIIGCNQAIRNEAAVEFCAQNEIRIVRRMSGGGAVYHDLGNINFCFLSNKTEKSSLSSEFLSPVIGVLTSLGIPVKMGLRKDLWLPDDYKISGTASHVAKQRELHHGTLLYDTNMEMLEEALHSPKIDDSVKAIASVRSTVKNLRTWFEEDGQSTPNPPDFFELLTRKLLQYFQKDTLTEFSKQDISQIQILVENKYTQQEWTYKK